MICEVSSVYLTRTKWHTVMKFASVEGEIQKYFVVCE